MKQAINHPKYDRRTLMNDVAVLKLNQDLTFSEVIQPILFNCNEVPDNIDCIVSGWGRTEGGKSSEKLRSVLLHTVNKETCQTNYNDERVKFRIPDTTMCAGVSQDFVKGETPKDSCSGDSVSLKSNIDLFSSLNFCENLRAVHL